MLTMFNIVRRTLKVAFLSLTLRKVLCLERPSGTLDPIKMSAILFKRNMELIFRIFLNKIIPGQLHSLPQLFKNEVLMTKKCS